MISVYIFYYSYAFTPRYYDQGPLRTLIDLVGLINQGFIYYLSTRYRNKRVNR